MMNDLLDASVVLIAIFAIGFCLINLLGEENK